MIIAVTFVAGVLIGAIGLSLWAYLVVTRRERVATVDATDYVVEATDQLGNSYVYDPATNFFRRVPARSHEES